MKFGRNGRLLWMGLAVVVMLASGAPAWADVKIGYFNMQAVMEQSKWGKQAKEEFQKEKDKAKADIGVKTDDFKTLKEEFDKKGSLLDEKARVKKIQELQQKRAESEKLLMQSTNELTHLSNELAAPIVKRIMEIVSKIGKDDKYDFIFEAQKSGLVYGTEKNDLTKRVLDELDKSPNPSK
jgi:outer membrane protein